MVGESLQDSELDAFPYIKHNIWEYIAMVRAIFAINLNTNMAQRYSSATEASRDIGISQPSISQILNKKQKRTQSIDGTWYTFCRVTFADDEKKLIEQIKWANSTPAKTKREKLKENRDLLLLFLENDKVLDFLRQYQEDPTILDYNDEENL